jgi:sec-independent protein translocase protein TatA
MIGDILQPTHLLFVLVVALLVLGPKRLPEASRAIGKGIRDFKMAVSGEEQDHGTLLTQQTSVTEPYAPVATPAPMPPSAEATAPAFAEDTAVTAPEGAPITAPEPATEPTSQPTEPAQPVA